MATTREPLRAPPQPCRPASTATPRSSTSSSAASSSAPGSSRLTSRACPSPGSYLTATAGRQPVLVLRDHDGDAARVPQRLPAPRLAPAVRVGRVRQGDPLPLPRLDLPARRRADRRARGALDPRPRQVGARPLPGARGDARRPRSSSTSTSTPSRSPSRCRASPERLAEYGIEGLVPHRPLDGSQPANWKIVADNYLEGYHVPIAHPGPDAAVRLQELQRRAARRLRLVRRAAARQAVRQPDGARLPAPRLADARAARGAPRASGATSTSIPTPRSTSIPIRSGSGSSTPTARWRTRDTAMLYRHPERLAAHAAGPVLQPQGERAGRRGGRGPGRERPGRAGEPRLGARPAVGARGGRRLVRRQDPRRPGRRAVTPSPRSPRAPASASSPPPSSGSRRTASTTCASRASRWTPASRPRSSTTTSRPARPCSSRRWSTPSSWPATCASARRRATRPTTPHRLAAMVDQCLPYPGQLERDWILWVELWLRAVRHAELRPTAARPLRAHAALVRRRDRGRRGGGRVRHAAPTRSARPTACWRCATASACAPCSATCPIERARAEVWAVLAQELGVDRAPPPGPA